MGRRRRSRSSPTTAPCPAIRPRLFAYLSRSRGDCAGDHLVVGDDVNLDLVLVQLAGRLGIGKLWIKDESYRFNLKAFKVEN